MSYLFHILINEHLFSCFQKIKTTNQNTLKENRSNISEWTAENQDKILWNKWLYFYDFSSWVWGNVKFSNKKKNVKLKD
jgi:hypothetical protein